MNIDYESIVGSDRATEVGQYVISPVDNTQISVKHCSILGKEEESAGWKIHISIDDQNDENIRVTFNRVVPIMMRYSLGMAKFLKTTCPKDDATGVYDHGRHITIYCSLQRFVEEGFTIAQWKELLTDITRALIECGIMPGYTNAVSKPIGGSNYCSYRYDRYRGEYIRCRKVYYMDEILQENKYRLDAEDDRFAELMLDIENQPEFVSRAVEAHGRDDCCNCRIF